jgi:hypothetical protein
MHHSLGRATAIPIPMVGLSPPVIGCLHPFERQTSAQPVHILIFILGRFQTGPDLLQDLDQFPNTLHSRAGGFVRSTIEVPV